MPWRAGPRAASLLLLSAGALTAASVGLRSRDDSIATSIDATLTRDAAGCAGVNGVVWHPLSGVDYTGRLHFTLPPRSGGAIALYVGDAMPLDLEATSDGDRPVLLHHERLISGPGVFLPPDFWLEDGSPLESPRYVSHVFIDASAEQERSVTLSLGRRAPRVLARLINFDPHVRVPVCADAMRDDELYFATGWYGEEPEPREGRIRWMREHGAVLLASRDGRAARVRMRLAPAVADAGDDTTQLLVRVNDVYDLEPIRLSPAFRDYELDVPDAAWALGTNELLLRVSRTQRIGTRTRGLALASLHVQ